ncbi:MAG TPA: ester cyclase [Chloroflexota bacterium]
MTADVNKQIARRALEALMTSNMTALRSLLAPDAVLHQCGFLEPVPAGAILAGEFPRRGLLSDREVRLERIIGEGDVVAMHWRTDGRYSDPHSPSLDGKQISFPSMSFIRFEEDRIAEIWNIQDTATMNTQLQSLAEGT